MKYINCNGEPRMPFCPECKYEYNPGITRCPDCEVDLVESLPTDQSKDLAEGASDADFVKVYTARDEMEAMMIKSVLEAAGIEVWDRSMVIHSLKWATVGPLAPEDLLVLEPHVEEATKIIEQLLESGGIVPGED